MRKWKEIPELANSCDIALRTWERRLSNKHSSTVQPLLQAPHIAAYLLDPLYADVTSEHYVNLPSINPEHEQAAKNLIQRVGGIAAERQFTRLILEGYSGSMASAAHACAHNKATMQAPAGSKRPRAEVASIKMRKGVWLRYGAQLYPDLARVALRLLSMHPTSASTERNWALWGRVYTSTRNTLGLERAKKLITFCFNSRAQEVDMRDFAMLLSVVEDNLPVGELQDSVEQL
jgi:hypothetical protein